MPNEPDTQGFRYYRYGPSMAAAIIFTILFFFTTMIHLYQFLRTRTWIMIPLLIGGFCMAHHPLNRTVPRLTCIAVEWIGYVGRTVSAHQTPNWTLGAYVVQILLILVAPALFAATIYMELGRIIMLCDGAHHSLIKMRWLTKVFVMGDVLSFVMQAAGEHAVDRSIRFAYLTPILGAGTTAAKTVTAVNNGQHIIIGGLFVQIIFFGFFLTVAIVFNRRINRKPTTRSSSPDIPWKKHMRVLYLASTLILIRSILRLEEYAEGTTGFVLSHEYFLYIFDAVPMLCVMVLFNLVHPSEVYALLRGGKMSQGLKLYTVGQPAEA